MDAKGLRENMGGEFVERNNGDGGKGTTEGDDDQEGGIVQYQPSEGFDAYCATEDSRGGDERKWGRT